MDIVTELVGDVIVVRLPGSKLDVSNVEAFRKQVPELLTQRHVVVDLVNVSFVDSSGLGALLSTVRRQCETGGDVKVCNVQAAVRTLFQLVRFHKVVDVCDDVPAAVAAFAAK